VIRLLEKASAISLPLRTSVSTDATEVIEARWLMEGLRMPAVG
jgi:hypothetical protein